MKKFITFFYIYILGISNTVIPQSFNPGIMLTFDDAHVNEWHAQLDLFDQYNARVTFFTCCMYAIGSPEESQILDIKDHGHEIAGHGYDHLNVVDYLQSHTEQNYIDVEIQPLLDYFTGLSIDLSSFAYPWGERTPQSDNLLDNYFDFLRGTSDPGGVEVKDNELCYIHPDDLDNTLIHGVGIDIIEKHKFAEISEAILKANNEGLIIVFYAHKPSDTASGYQIKPAFLDSILSYTYSLGMSFYTVDDIRTLRDSTLPIGLTLFTATAGEDQVELRWKTASEIENLGFELWRSAEDDQGYQLLDSYKNNDDLKGAGSTANENNYLYIDTFVLSGTTYWYKLIDVDWSGKRTEHSPISEFVPYPDSDKRPLEFVLQQNYPNPFNPSTTIRFNIPNHNTGLTNVNLTIYDLLGKKVKTLIKTSFTTGRYEVKWDARNDAGLEVPSGIYIYRFRTDNFSHSKNMMLLK
jgi:peptidoglycan/xylan/chitin deacetylase (PgdA/CDA1 family)